MLHKGTLALQEFQLLGEKWQLGLNVSNLGFGPGSANNVCATLGKTGHCVACQFHFLSRGDYKNQA